MSEMLANRYFLAGRFGDAAVLYEAVLRKHADHVQARKKLVLCYAMLGRLREAVELAAGLLRENPSVFIRTDVPGEGFPCRRMLDLAERDAGRLDAGERHVRLGLIQLFCDEARAVQEFDLARHERVDLGDVPAIQALLRRNMEAGHGH